MYNSDSGEEQLDVETLSDELAIEKNEGWVHWYCTLEGHEFLLQVETEYIRDGFNLHGLLRQFNLYLAMSGSARRMSKDRFRKCLQMILSPLAPNAEDLADEGFLELNQEASELYGLIHARYVYTPRGLARIFKKFLSAGYGYCPRALCDKQKNLPVGISDLPRTARFKVFCPRCEEVYIPKYRNNNVDGAVFGTSFPHVFIQHYPNAVILPPKVYLHEPKIFGFKIYGKRGSKYFKAPIENGLVRVTDESLDNQEKQRRRDEIVKTIVSS